MTLYELIKKVSQSLSDNPTIQSNLAMYLKTSTDDDGEFMRTRHYSSLTEQLPNRDLGDIKYIIFGSTKPFPPQQLVDLQAEIIWNKYSENLEEDKELLIESGYEHLIIIPVEGSHKISKEFIKQASYITRTDNPFTLYEYYTPGHSILDLLSLDHPSTLIKEKCEKVITSDELVEIINQLLELQKLGIEVHSQRIPLLESEYKFKGFRQVKFSYTNNEGLHELLITNKKKEIHLEYNIKQEGVGE